MAIMGNPSGVLHVDTTAVGNVGAGTDNLMTYSLPGGTMAVGRGVRITAWGTTANNANPKTVVLAFGSTILSTALTISIAGAWRIQAEVILTAASVQSCIASLTQGATSLADVERTALTETDSAAITIKCTGTVTDGGGGINNDDIVQRGLIVEYI